MFPDKMRKKPPKTEMFPLQFWSEGNAQRY